MSKIFLDTNIAIYAFDEAESRKHGKAKEILRELALSGEGVVSTQVLQEFCVAATQKLRIQPQHALELTRYIAGLETVQVSPELIYQAGEISIRYKLSFWDGLIIAAAESAKCISIYSEDLQSGQTVRGMRIENPFKF